MSALSVTKHILLSVFGLLNTIAGAVFLWTYLKPPTHTISAPVVYVLAAWIAFGAFLIAPYQVGQAGKFALSLLPFKVTPKE